MEQLHKNLLEKYSWYATYHQLPFLTPLHFFALIVIGASISVAILGSIQIAEEELTAASYTANSGTNASWHSYSEDIQSGKLAAAGVILEVSFIYDTDVSPALAIDTVQRKNGYVPTYEVPASGAYTLEVLDDDEVVLKTLSFALPSTPADPPPQVGERNVRQQTAIKKRDFALTVPWVPAVKIVVRTTEGTVIASKTLLNIPVIDNVPNFHSVKGDEFKKNFPAPVSLLPTSYRVAHAAINPTNILDLTFIGDKYATTDMALFHADVDRVVAHLLAYEPFRSRAAQINVHYVDNTSDLGCVYDAVTARLLVCNSSLVTQAVNTAGAPYDKIAVLVNSTTYGGSGGAISIAYNGQWSREVFVHEFGHSLGLLRDEYNLYPNGSITNTVSGNCYSGNPPASAWAGIIALQDYALGCDYSNWYRSSADNIMISLSYPYFNAISQMQLNKKIDYFTGPMQDTTLPLANIVSPLGGATVSGTISVTTTAIDNLGIAWMDLYVDGVLYRKVYKAPFSFILPTTAFSNGTHTLHVKAYDVPGNVGVSSILSINVSNAIDSIKPTVSITSPLSGATVSGFIYVGAVATDNSGTVSRVDFYKDGVKVGLDTTSPYEYPWESGLDADGSHIFVAKAYDPSGNEGVSATTTVSTKNADTTAPTTSIVSPASGTIISGAMAVSASGSDNVGVARVDLWIDGALFASDTSAPFSWALDTTKLANGTHTLHTKVSDLSGNVGASATVSVTVSNTVVATDTAAPSVAILTPVNGAKIKGNSSPTITVTANDTSGIASITISIDGALKQTCTSATSCSYTWSGKSITVGTHTITATAIDASLNGNKSTVLVSVKK